MHLVIFHIFQNYLETCYLLWPHEENSHKNFEAVKWLCGFSLDMPFPPCSPHPCFTPSSSPGVWQLFSILRWLSWNMYLSLLCYLSSYCSNFFSLPGEISVVASEVWIKGAFMVVMTVKVKFRLLEGLKQRSNWSPHHLHLIWVVNKLFWK